MNTRSSKGITKPRVLFDCESFEQSDCSDHTEGARGKKPKAKKTASSSKTKKSSEKPTDKINNRKLSLEIRKEIANVENSSIVPDTYVPTLIPVGNRSNDTCPCNLEIRGTGTCKWIICNSC